MTDDELEFACRSRSNKVTLKVYWTSEVYSIGKCLRLLAKYPHFLPLYVYSDHGVSLNPHLYPHDLENTANVYFTWNPVKAAVNRDLAVKSVTHIIHPWIPYRRLQGITRSSKPEGTLVFFAHNTPEVKWKWQDEEDYFNILRELPSKFQPVVICLHMHDVNAGFHKKLRPYGFPIVTVGNVNSNNFVDRFYDLVKTFSYATSPEWGSQVAYCIELGVPYFFFGERPRLINIADRNLPKGEVPQYWNKFHEQYSKNAETLFRVPVDKVTEEQRAFIEPLLGMDSKITAEQVSRILWREFSRNFWKPHITLRPVLISLIHKFRLYRLIKIVQEKFNSKQ